MQYKTPRSQCSEVRPFRPRNESRIADWERVQYYSTRLREVGGAGADHKIPRTQLHSLVPRPFPFGETAWAPLLTHAYRIP